MSLIEYLRFDKIDPNEFVPLLNKKSTREHLIAHEKFDTESVAQWMKAKIEVDQIEGCRVRALSVNGVLAGWCAIQSVDTQYEIAIVLDEHYWGIGKKVFGELMQWAQEFGHDKIYIHLLHTRPEYKFLRKMSTNVYESMILGSKFTTYELNLG
ncbi:GNAT family N-acetyltransferase [bacterium (Candidatus Blackallbacteria) CG17_big_fil_post_rev_8_21_14_2_50_48_46]|uniref:GNAT family N-acetyltransferase n=1 Tax=bacterium (Candidatus Blackallbacteria) CG17_big_fil_post_rev_8_21_14_2_50_48_46 TaxID=2014261 RepID=A0A2M7GAC7_9BACT|nr:MAG: GNAT family N-acetyltransferase [bacterium (Candidatus Blackallbacteria) CG18_big_fil_WC_8_21_14_2_50_49_26]PIW19098.1 MAG: GNAT family N-acetyltransferase [bacterium (Candidatus Blackallbacteria) CG17_big_fil_post_rev_8_21_14_2_50_48_46]PIW44535.1 MAG: GNAT family N-acetyltransferase [bacterium (Candidatus Blackallbacteria) CG13_big_fil_rev_8_21_14_2_50_49_14]